tara:strand:- start:969 stop:1232 length:264 start_codon:yes stop_codon:yes gene_type:complete
MSKSTSTRSNGRTKNSTSSSRSTGGTKSSSSNTGSSRRTCSRCTTGCKKCEPIYVNIPNKELQNFIKKFIPPKQNPLKPKKAGITKR